METKIDIHGSKKSYTKVLENLERSDMLPENKAALQEFLRYASLGRIGRGAKERKLLRYEYLIRKVNSLLGNRPFREIPKEDFERWYEALTQGKIVSEKNKLPYSASTRSDMIKDFKAFMKWYDEGKHFYKISWFKLHKKKAQHEVFTLTEVKAILQETKDIETRFYIALAFDSGARPEELHNCRKHDFRFLDAPGTPPSYWLNVRYSKDDRQPRDIPVPNFTEIYNEYLGKYGRHLRDDAPLLTVTYRTSWRRLKNLEEKTGQKITHYKLRRSSWTYWGGIIRDKYKLNKRMGEVLSSAMADTYINSDVLDTAYSESITTSRKDEVQELREEIAALRKVVSEQKTAEENIKEFFTPAEMQKLLKTVHKLRKEMVIHSVG